MSTATSSSDRYAQARKALAQFEAYMEGFCADEFGPEVHRLAEAMRALIEPAAVEESVEEIAQRILASTSLPPVGDSVLFADLEKITRAAIERGVYAGIQAAWLSWEPETATGVPSGSLEQLAADAREAVEDLELSTESNGMDDVFTARDRAASVLRDLVALVERNEDVATTVRETQLVDIVFDGPPEHEPGRFIEVEDMAGASVKAGEWFELDRGRWALRVEVVK